MLVSGVHPGAILNVVFCVIWCLLIFVSDAIGSVIEYGPCYGFVCGEDSFLLLPHVVNVSALSICTKCFACFCCCVIEMFFCM